MKSKETPVENMISPSDLAARLGPGCDGIILDVRTPAEFKGGHIPGARLMPLGDLRPADFLERQAVESKRIYVVCHSGARARKAIEAFAREGFGGCVLLSGGMEAWSRANLETVREAGAGLPIMRQVQIVIGAVNLFGSLLAIFVDARFALIPLLTACGLLLAGFSGWCGLALFLARMPWNRLSASGMGTCGTKGGTCS